MNEQQNVFTISGAELDSWSRGTGGGSHDLSISKILAETTQGEVSDKKSQQQGVDA